MPLRSQPFHLHLHLHLLPLLLLLLPALLPLPRAGATLSTEARARATLSTEARARATLSAEARARATLSAEVRADRAQQRTLLANLSPHLDPLERGMPGRCKCPSAAPFSTHLESRFQSAHIVLRAKVLRYTEQTRYTRGGAIPQFLIRHYILHATGRYKGGWPRVGSFFQAQGYVHGDSCGLRLEVGRQYLFNLDNPAQVSPGNVWKRGVFVIDRCQSHFGWQDLSKDQLRFLLLRSK